MSTDDFNFGTLCKNGLSSECTQFLFTRTAICIVLLIYVMTKGSQLYTLLHQGKNLKLNSFTVYLECFTSLKIIIYSAYMKYSYFSYIEYLTIFFFNVAILFVWLKSQTSTNFIIKSTARLVLSCCLYCLVLLHITPSTIQFFAHAGSLLTVMMFGNELLDFFSSYYEFSHNATIQSKILQNQHPGRVSKLLFVIQLVVLVARMLSLSTEYPNEKVLQSHYIIKFLCTALLLIQVIVLNRLSPDHISNSDGKDRHRFQQSCQDKMTTIAQFNTATSPALSHEEPPQRYHKSSRSQHQPLQPSQHSQQQPKASQPHQRKRHIE